MILTLQNLHMYCKDCGDCLLWSQGVNNTGYPQATLEGQPGTMVRRYIFTRLLGRTIEPGKVVSSRCDNRLCCSPEHLIGMRRGSVQERSYKTGKRLSAAEYANRLAASQRAGISVLTWDKVHSIRARPFSESDAAIAREFGVHPRTICKVRNGTSWRQQMAVSSVFAWKG